MKPGGLPEHAVTWPDLCSSCLEPPARELVTSTEWTEEGKEENDGLSSIPQLELCCSTVQLGKNTGQSFEHFIQIEDDFRCFLSWT
jgi:hypothetical protein